MWRAQIVSKVRQLGVGRAIVKIWPRLSRAIATSEWERLKAGMPSRGGALLRDVQWRAVGNRADVELKVLGDSIRELAKRFGFPDTQSQDAQMRFDREAAVLIRELVDASFADAAAGEVWSYVALAILPDVTRWRFGLQNKERWVCTDLTRHAWGRLWWQGEAYRPEPELLESLSEGDLNQLFERRNIGGDGGLVRELTRAFDQVRADRRLVVRDATKRIGDCWPSSRPPRSTKPNCDLSCRKWSTSRSSK